MSLVFKNASGIFLRGHLKIRSEYGNSYRIFNAVEDVKKDDR